MTYITHFFVVSGDILALSESLGIDFQLERRRAGKSLELGMPELNAMKAPGFWMGFSIGGSFSIGVTAIDVAAT
ncbi:hypothetical protein [Actinomyces qiguomingii]|uniref:hypothetical protein n=1 Tax=Actinomyces qiguomingii TaxID=2057800 RepID=UPI000FFE86B6|nr:hypothetical protein [Actinomyces qiguomingii]